MADKKGKWWAGRNEEWFTVGPLDSREQAIDEGCTIAEEFEQDHFYIAEAELHEVRFNAARLIESQYFENEDWFNYEDGREPDRLGNAEAADRELQALLDAWTVEYGDTFVKPSMFAWCRTECVSLSEAA